LTAFSRSLTNNLADLIEWAGPASNYRILAYKISPKSDISRKYGDNDFHDGRRPPCLIQIFKKKITFARRSRICIFAQNFARIGKIWRDLVGVLP